MSQGKKWLATLGLLTALFVGVSATAAIYKYDLFDAAMQLERENAGLSIEHVQVDDLSITYLATNQPEMAEKPVMVLIHGFGAIKENWVRYAAQLKGQFRIIAVDLPGHGESSKELNRTYSIASQVEFLNRFLEVLEIPRAHFAGNSMGGAIAAMFGAHYPEKTETLVLFDPAGIFDFKAPFQEMLATGENPLIVKSDADFSFLIDFAMEKPPVIPWPISEVAAERAMAKSEINLHIFKQLVAPAEDDFKIRLADIAAPTLIIWGTEDRIIDVRNADVFQALIPNASTLIYEGVGHVPMLEVPAQSSRDVVAFISSAK